MPGCGGERGGSDGDPRRASLSVGVVIPTIGRSTLLDSVFSALGQTFPPRCVAVVVDGPVDKVSGLALPPDPRLVVLSNRPSTGAAACRNVGVRYLDTDLVALLDDDDTWLPTKLELQLAAYRSLLTPVCQHPVIACRSVKTQVSSGRTRLAPLDTIRPGQRVGDYLFRRRRVSPYGAAIGHSMLLFERSLAVAEPFNETLRRHDDWDWALRVGGHPGVGFHHVPEVLLRYAVHAGSTSLQSGWEVSMRWALSRGRYLTRREQADFLLCISAPLAVRYKDWRGLASVVGRARRSNIGSLRAWLYLALVLTQALVRGWRSRFAIRTGKVGG